MSANHTNKLERLQQLANSISLPKDMVLGAATASYQIEGAINEGGRGPTVWDHFTHIPGNIADGTNGDIACDHYHRLEEDVALMKELGLTAYRFSICWSRILPNGRGPINEDGLAFYERLTDLLLEAGITPYATLYHWDLPLPLQEEGNGWLRRNLVEDYVHYVNITTKRLGAKIKHWTTFNELFTFTWWGYGLKEDAPGLGGGAKAALTASHHALLAHGKAVPVIRKNVPDAQIGIVLDLNPVTPASNAPADIDAARRFEGCQNRWYLDAIFKGQYPADMLETYKDVLPAIEPGDLDEIAQPLDYLGINIYRRSVIEDGTEFAPVNFKRHLPEGQYTQMVGKCIHSASMTSSSTSTPTTHRSNSTSRRTAQRFQIQWRRMAAFRIGIAAPICSLTWNKPPEPLRMASRSRVTSAGPSWTISSGPKATCHALV